MSTPKSLAQAGKDALKNGADALAAEASEQVNAAKSRAADAADAEARRLNSAAQEMQSDAPHTEAVNFAATRAQHAADHLRASTPADLVADLTDIARRNPLIAFTAAAAAGFAVGRFVKSTNPGPSFATSSDLSLRHIPQGGAS